MYLLDLPLWERNIISFLAGLLVIASGYTLSMILPIVLLYMLGFSIGTISAYYVIMILTLVSFSILSFYLLNKLWGEEKGYSVPLLFVAGGLTASSLCYLFFS